MPKAWLGVSTVRDLPNRRMVVRPCRPIILGGGEPGLCWHWWCRPLGLEKCAQSGGGLAGPIKASTSLPPPTPPYLPVCQSFSRPSESGIWGGGGGGVRRPVWPNWEREPLGLTWLSGRGVHTGALGAGKYTPAGAKQTRYYGNLLYIFLHFGNFSQIFCILQCFRKLFFVLRHRNKIS
jgi:hypothetical protein